MFLKNRNASKHTHGARRSRLNARRNECSLRIEELEERRLLTVLTCQSPDQAAEISEHSITASTTESAPVKTASSMSIQSNKGGQPPSAGISVSTAPTFASPGLMITTERGGTAEFRVVLDSQPTANVTINLTSSNAAEGITNVPSLLFTPNDWNTPKTVRVTGVDDLLADGNVAYLIFTQPATSSDPNYNGRNAADVSLASGS